MLIEVALAFSLYASLDDAPEPLTQMHGHIDDERTHWEQIDMSKRPQGELNMPGDLQSDAYQRWWQRQLNAKD